MVVKATKLEGIHTLADLHKRLGYVPLHRILFDPVPGTATESDAVRLLEAAGKQLVELIDGVLVEKPMGQEESRMGLYLGGLLLSYCDDHDLGWVSGADAASKMRQGNIRLPDISVYPWAMFPEGEMPDEAVASVCPWLGVEVLSDSNTEAEIALKLREFFASGMRLAWIIDPATRTAKVHSGPKRFRLLDEDSSLEGGSVVPGFSCTLKSIFEKGLRQPRRPKRTP